MKITNIFRFFGTIWAILWFKLAEKRPFFTRKNPGFPAKKPGFRVLKITQKTRVLGFGLTRVKNPTLLTYIVRTHLCILVAAFCIFASGIGLWFTPIFPIHCTACISEYGICLFEFILTSLCEMFSSSHITKE